MAVQTTNPILPIRRNTSNQIISYTLPDDSINEYGQIRKVGQRTSFDNADFNRVILEKPTELVNPIPIFELSILKLPELDLGIFIEKYKWTGELVRIGTLPESDFFYIEDGIYHTMEGNGIINLIAEKLGKPIFFRIGHKYHDASSTIDFGQNQYHIYDDVTYNRTTSAYVDSFEEGEVITPIDVMIPGLFSREIRIENRLADAVFTSPSVFPNVNHSGVTGISSTRASWWLHNDDYERDIITSIGDVITMKFNTQPGPWEYQMQLQYEGGTDVSVHITDTVQTHTVSSGGQYTDHTYDIPGYLITDKIKQINIILPIPGYTGQTIVGTPTGNI